MNEPTTDPALDREIESELGERLRSEPEVVAAYLFGSRARGTARHRSDVDIAVLLEDDDPDTHLRVVAAVAEVVGSERADVVVLNRAPVALAYRVLRDGRLLCSRDEAVRLAHWVETVDRYLDMAPMRRALDEGLQRRLEGSRFGRP